MWKWAVLALAGVVPLGGTARAQDYAPPDPGLPLPLYNNRPEEGGYFGALSYIMYRQTNPLQDQPIAWRGFVDVDGSISQAINPPGGFTPGARFGSFREALNVDQVTGPNPYQPGFKVEVGWKFGDSQALTLGWKYLFQSRRQAVATLIPQNYLVGNDLSDTFLFSPVFNFPPEYAGAPRSVNVGNDYATYGIWNGASVMTIDFEQKFQQWEMTWRETIYQTECYRLSALFGLRFAWSWERFRWRTSDYNFNGGIDPSAVSIYSNVISNRMYGAHVGLQSEYYLGHGIAAFAEAQGSLFMNIVKTRVKYELGAKHLPPANKRALTSYTFVPEVEASVGLMWYPWEGVQFKFGYDFMAFFNTMTSPNPVTFDYSGLNPWFSQNTVRFMDGFHASIALSF
jgi:hypothetical protein